MTTMMEVTQADPTLQSGVSHLAQSGMPYKIKRAGGRPLRFNGSELAMAMSYTSGIPYWYEINLYRTADQGFVAAVRLFHQSEDLQDTVQAKECSTLDEAIEWLINYDAAADLALNLEVDMSEAPASEMGVLALQLMARIADVRHHYASLVGELLHDLENPE